VSGAPGSFQLSQGIEVLAPKGGPAYPIPCGEWDHLKSRLQQVSGPPWFFQTCGSVLLGGALSALITIFTGTFVAGSKPLVVAWAVVASTSICGIALFVLGHQQSRLQRIAVADVLQQMLLIEKRYERGEA
jgi:hypothetical protein